MDMDRSGALSKVEVYCAVLKLYTKIIKLCPTAKPPSKTQVDDLVEAMDDNNDNTISLAEFEDLARHICEHVATRLAIQWVTSLIGAPVAASILTALLDAATPGVLTFWIPFKSWLRSARNSLMVSLVMSLVMPKLLDAGWRLVDRNAERRERFRELNATMTEPEPEEQAS